ncbi:hypothetical protein C8R44DRAFT_751559 [Mycena epipterygia]|nr:hypothetical protein C8R44DRAFT_751559 [Mycena epipterygia]
MFTPSLSTPHPFRGPSFRRFGGASGSQDVEPDRFRAGLVACSQVVSSSDEFFGTPRNQTWGRRAFTTRIAGSATIVYMGVSQGRYRTGFGRLILPRSRSTNTPGRIGLHVHQTFVSARMCLSVHAARSPGIENLVSENECLRIVRLVLGFSKISRGLDDVPIIGRHVGEALNNGGEKPLCHVDNKIFKTNVQNSSNPAPKPFEDDIKDVRSFMASNGFSPLQSGLQVVESVTCRNRESRSQEVCGNPSEKGAGVLDAVRIGLEKGYQCAPSLIAHQASENASESIKGGHRRTRGADARQQLAGGCGGGGGNEKASTPER